MSLMSARIHSKRLEHNYTMEELGAKVGVSKSTVNKWEKGQIENIKRTTIHKLSIALDCDPVWLMGIDTDSTKSNCSDDRETEMIRLFSALPAEKQDIVLGLLRSMSTTK